MNRSITAGLLAGMFCILMALPAGMAFAQRELVDKVVAVVEDEPIFKSDLDQMVKQYMVQRGTGTLSDSQRAVMQKQALDELISNKLVLVQAKKLGIDVPFADVESNVDKALEENRRTLGGEKAFMKQLEAEGLTLEELKQLYREQIRNRMLIERVLARDIDRSKMQVTETELKRKYEEAKKDFPKRPAVVHLASILFSFQSSSKAQAEAKRTIESIRNSIETEGVDFAQAAKEFSEDPSKESGGDLGWLNLDDIQEQAFSDAARKLEVGDVSPPVMTAFGYHIIQLLERNDENGEVHLRHILVRVTPSDDDIEAVYRRAQEVREELGAGAPFDSMAIAHSDDSATASKGGDLGWLKVEDLPDFFRDVLKDMQPNDISPVLRESAGFRIVKLLDREREREYSFDEVKGELRKGLEQEKMNTIFENYINGLREQFYVDVRL